MKNKLLVFFLLLLPFISRAQVGVQPMGAPNVINKAKGGLDEDSSLRMPGVFPTSWTWTDSCRRMWMTGGNVYFHDCTGRIQFLSMKDTAFIKSLIASGGSVMWSNITGKPTVFPPDTTIAATQSDLLQSLAPIDANLQNINNDTAKWNTAAAAITPIEANLQNINNDTAKWNSALQVETDPVFRADSGKIMHQRDTVTKYSTPTSVLGQVVAYVSSVFNGLFDGRLSTKTTDNLTEGSTNKYYTDARVQTVIGSDTTANKLSTPTSVSSQIGSAGALKVNYNDSVFKYVTPTSFTGLFNTQFATKSTTSLVEGSNLYYTDARVQTVIGSDTTTNKLSTPTSVSGQLSAYIAANFNTLFDTRLGTKTTTNLTEGSNLYYTDARVQTVVGSDTAANKLSTPTSTSALISKSTFKNNSSPIFNYTLNGSNAFTQNSPANTLQQALFPIGVDSFCHIYIVDTTGGGEVTADGRVFIHYSYGGGGKKGTWTAPTVLFTPPAGFGFVEVVQGYVSATNTYMLILSEFNIANQNSYRDYIATSTNKCQSFTSLTQFPNIFRDTTGYLYGAFTPCDSGICEAVAYGGTSIEAFGQVIQTTDGTTFTVKSTMYDTALSINKMGESSIGNISVRGDTLLSWTRYNPGNASTTNTYMQHISVNNGNTWTEIGPVNPTFTDQKNSAFTTVSPVLQRDSINGQIWGIWSLRHQNPLTIGHAADGMFVFAATYANALTGNFSYIGEIPRPQPTAFNAPFLYPKIARKNDSTWLFVFSDYYSHGLSATRTPIANGITGTGYLAEINYRTSIIGNKPIIEGGTAVWSSIEKAFNIITNPGEVNDTNENVLLSRNSGAIEKDFSGIGNMPAGSIIMIDSLHHTFVLPPGTVNQGLRMNASGYPGWNTATLGTVTIVTCGNIASGGNIWSSTVTNGTTTPAISFNIVNQVAHAMFGNHGVSTGSPTMAILTTADIPVIPLSTGVSGTLPAAQFPALTGDVTTSVGAVATTIAANAVSNSKLAQMTANTIKLNNTGSTANAIDGTIAQLNTMLGLGTLQFGTSTFSGNAVATTFTVTVPSGVQAYSCVSNTPGTAIVTGANVSGTTLTITCAAAPVLGTNNVIISYTLK